MSRSKALGISVGLLLTLSFVAFSASDAPMIVVFYEEGCPDCLKLEEFLAGMMTELPESAIVRYEIHEPGALKLLGALETEYGVETPSVPATFVGDIAVFGADHEAEFQLRDAISRCELFGCPSPLDRILTEASIRTDVLRSMLLVGLFILLLLWQTF